MRVSFAFFESPLIDGSSEERFGEIRFSALFFSCSLTPGRLYFSVRGNRRQEVSVPVRGSDSEEKQNVYI